MLGDVGEALDLGVLGGEVRDRVENEIGQGEITLDPGGGEVANCDSNCVAAWLRPQLLNHRSGEVDATDTDPPFGERQGDAVLRLEPTYAMYDVYGRIFGGRQIVVDYRASTDGPILDLDELHSTLESRAPRLVCVPNPASPTGTVLDLDDLASIAEAVNRHDGVLVVDEAYYPFDPVTAVSLLADHPNIVVVRTFSKAWAMSGLRIGYCVAGPEMTRLLHKVRPGYETNFVAVRMAEALLAEEETMLRSVARLNDGRDRFLDEMVDLGLRTALSGGNFLLVEFAGHAPQVHRALEDLVLYRRDFGHPSVAGFSGFSATTSDRFAPVAARIRTVIGDGR